MACNVLISAAGRRVQLLEIFRRAVSELAPGSKILASDVHELSSAWHRADEGVLLPRAGDPGFDDAIFDLCARAKIGLVVPTIDTELAAYAAIAPALAAAGTTVAVSSPDAISICGSKRRTHDWLAEHGFPVPKQWNADEALLLDEHVLKFPLIVKPDRGSSSIGLSLVRDRSELQVALKASAVVIEEVALGHEYTVDVFVDAGGAAHSAVPRRRLETRAGEVSKGLTVHDPSVEDLVVRVAAALPGARGCLNVQVFLDPTTSRMAIIEINPRFGGGYPLTDHAGAKYANWLLEEALGLPASIPTTPAWRPNTLMLRYDDAVYLDDWE